MNSKQRWQNRATARQEDPLQCALGALADIAYAKDMTYVLARRKAKRIYEELSAIAAEEARGWPTPSKGTAVLPICAHCGHPAAPGAAAPSRSAEFERGRRQGIEQEHALWLLAKEGQRADATEARDEIMRLSVNCEMSFHAAVAMGHEHLRAKHKADRAAQLAAVSRALGLES